MNARQAGLARALSVMYATGGFFAGIALVLPHPGGSNIAGVLGIAVAAFAAALVFAVAGDHMPLPAIHLGLASGTALICIAIYCWRPGEIASSVALLFVWVTLYAFYFLPSRAAAAHTAFVAVAYAFTLAVQAGRAAPVTQWIVTIGTATVAGVVIGRLGRDVRRAAGTDPLTGAATRRRWTEAAAAETARAARRGGSLAVALLDLDGFKAINDEHGHGFGDRFLRETCAAWSRELRPGDVLGRYGGDEFVLLLPDCDDVAAVAVTERLLGAHPCPCTVGLTLWRTGESIDELIQRVDEALYTGKRSGRGRIVFVS